MEPTYWYSNVSVSVFSGGALSHAASHSDKWHVSSSARDPQCFHCFIWRNENIKECMPETGKRSEGAE